MDTMEALVSYHCDERHIFRRMVEKKIDTNINVFKWVIAFWMYLESNGFKGLLGKLSSHDDKVLGLVFAEAKTARIFLQPDTKEPLLSTCVPITSNLSNPTVSFSDVFKDKEKVSKGVYDLYNGVCGMIFEDILEESGLKDDNGDGEGSFTNVSPSGSKLNPLAKEWSPLVERAPKENRSLFMTFSRGFPLTEEEIIGYFTTKYGECVENVYVHNARGREPEFGKVVFKASFMAAVVLKDMEQARLWVNGRPMWLKRYKPKNQIA